MAMVFSSSLTEVSEVNKGEYVGKEVVNFCKSLLVLLD